MLYTLLFIVAFYLLIIFIVGRYLAFHDLFVSKRHPDSFSFPANTERVEFYSHDNLLLKGAFIRSTFNEKGKTIVLVHGWDDSKEDLVNHIPVFTEAGYHVFVFDQRSHGESETGLVTFGELEAKDLIKAVSYLRKRNEINPEYISAAGFSLGTSAIIIALADQPEIFRSIIIEGYFSSSYDVGAFMLNNMLGNLLGKIVATTIFTTGTFLWSRGKFRHSVPYNWIGDIENTPILFIRGEKDHMVPKESAESLFQKTKAQKVSWFIPGGGHINSLELHPNEYKKRLAEFLNSTN